MKADKDVGRLKAFAKRLMQACASAPPSFTCGCLLLLSEVSKAVPALQAMAMQKDSEAQRPKPPKQNGEAAERGSAGPAAAAAAAYTWDKRDPRHANAEGAGLWEAAVLQSHYHPSVQQFVASLLNGGGIRYAGDPLRDFQLTPFLDKFVFKNPKANTNTAGGSLMQPVASARSSGLSHADISKLADAPAAKVEEHEKFFHTYFAAKKQAELRAQERRGKKGGKKKAAAADGEAREGVEGEEEDEEEEEEEEAFARKLAENMLQDEAVVDEDSDEDEDDLAALDGMGGGGDDDDEAGEGVDFSNSLDFPGMGGEDDDEEEEEEAAAAAKPTGKKAKGRKSTFASAEDFSEMLEAAADENEGVHPRLAEWEDGRSRKRKRR